MRYRYLNSPWQRSVGAMFRKNLGSSALIFCYPHAAPRLFHTAFCPLLRILCLDDTGQVIFDQIVRPFRFIRLPPTRIVVELAPQAKLDPAVLAQIVPRALQIEQPAAGSWNAETGLDRLFFALIAGAVADMRRVYELGGRAKTLCPKILRERFAVWERGQLACSAAFLIEGADELEIPENALRLAGQLLEEEHERGCLDELLAASIGGSPWELPRNCLRCGRLGTWRPVLEAPCGMAPEMAWRYTRPENCVPLCFQCAYRLGWKECTTQLELVAGLWGVRFEALARWHAAASSAQLPAGWDKELFPLWPESFGGDAWETGSGALDDVDPQPPDGVLRTLEQLELLAKHLRPDRAARYLPASPQAVPVAYTRQTQPQGAHP